MYYAKIGKSKNLSIFQYLEYIKTVDRRPLYKHCISLIAVVVSLLLTAILPKVGLVPLLAIFAINVITYWPNRQYAATLMGNLKNIEEMVKAAQEFHNINEPILKSTIDILDKSKKFIKTFKGSMIAFQDRTANIGDANALLDYTRMLTHFDYVFLLRIMNKVNDRYDDLYQVAEALGYLESMIAIASFRESLSYYTVPELYDHGSFNVKNDRNSTIVQDEFNRSITQNTKTSKKTTNKNSKHTINAKELYHPLIDDPVANSIHTENGVLLTGSNASGKSTFLRTVAINAICAQTIHTCFASSYESDFFKIRSAMSLRDSLSNGDSYFIVEIDTIKSIIDEACEVPILCFVDEILRGTNTIERIAAATEILRYMSQQNILCFGASHDIELTKLLREQYDMYHFQEYINNGMVEFDYILYPGAVTTRNAIRLLEAKQYEQSIVNNAIDLVDYFEQHGEWPVTK